MSRNAEEKLRNTCRNEQQQWQLNAKRSVGLQMQSIIRKTVCWRKQNYKKQKSFLKENKYNT